MGKIVVVAALDGTFQRKPFGSILNLVPIAENVTKLSAVCVNCQDDAAFSLRVSDETAVEVIGGADKYVAVCRRCYNNATSSTFQSAQIKHSDASMSIHEPSFEPVAGQFADVH